MLIASDSAASPSSAVLLVNLGTPTAPTPAAVDAFLSEFLSDQRVVELPALFWRPILHGIVIPLRKKRVAHAYASIWEDGSPLRNISQRQCDALQQRLDTVMGSSAPRVKLAMTYQGPSIADVLDECRREGLDRIVVLPLYPQYSATTTGAVTDQVARYMLAHRDVPHIQVIRDYHVNPELITALANSVREHWQHHGRSDHLLMSFHGIPEVNVKKGDPYARQCEATAAALAQALALEDGQWTMAYQSRFGKQKWLEPYTDQTLERMASDGVGSIDVMCPAFSVDCLETLEEMAQENKALFLEHGGKDYRFIPCLNDRDDHITAMVSVLRANGVLCKPNCGSGCSNCRFN